MVFLRVFRNNRPVAIYVFVWLYNILTIHGIIFDVPYQWNSNPDSCCLVGQNDYVLPSYFNEYI